MYGERPLFRSRPRLQINNETDGLFDHVTNLDLDGRGMGSSAHRKILQFKRKKDDKNNNNENKTIKKVY